jgi:hypothetical protein
MLTVLRQTPAFGPGTYISPPPPVGCDGRRRPCWVLRILQPRGAGDRQHFSAPYATASRCDTGRRRAWPLYTEMPKRYDRFRLCRKTGKHNHETHTWAELDSGANRGRRAVQARLAGLLRLPRCLRARGAAGFRRGSRQSRCDPRNARSAAACLSERGGRYRRDENAQGKTHQGACDCRARIPESSPQDSG